MTGEEIRQMAQGNTIIPKTGLMRGWHPVYIDECRKINRKAIEEQFKVRNIMYLEKLIKKLKEANCSLEWERRNVAINIAICEMQIKIRDGKRS